MFVQSVCVLSLYLMMSCLSKLPPENENELGHTCVYYENSS